MSRTSSLSGLGRGRARGRRDIAEGEQLAERRPGRSRAEDWEGELAGTQSESGSQWISMEDSAPSPYLGYSGAPPRGARIAQFSSEFRRADNGEFRGADEDAASSVRMRADRIMCSEVTSMRDEQNEQDEHWTFRAKKEERDCQTEQDSDSVTSEQRRHYPVELSSRGVRQSIEDLRAEFGRELRAQQEMFLWARADLKARQEEAIANA